MAHRKNVEIKTQYDSLEDCRENCRDIKKRFALPIPASGKIYGEILEDGSFVLSSRKAKTSVIFEFVGRIEKRDDGIYLVGEIRPKRYQRWIMYGFAFFFHLLGIVFVMIGTPGWIAYGIFLFAIAWVYVLYLRWGDSFYADLIRKVQEL